MQILVLGNSNSITTNGYVAGLRAQFRGLKVDNKSVGHSPGTQFAYYGRWNFSRYDAVIFDSIANDEIYVAEVGGYEFLKNLYFELFSTIASQTRLIVLGFFRRPLDTPMSDIYNLQADLCELTGATFVGFHDFVLRHGPSIVPKGVPLMINEAHPQLSIAQQFGHHIGRIIADLPRPVGPRENFRENFDGIAAAAGFSGEVRRKSTSLRSCDLAIMREGDTIRLKRASTPVGFLVDRSYTRGFLRLDGPEGARTKAIIADDRNLSLNLRFIPLRGRLPVEEIRCVSPQDTFEETLHATGEVGPDFSSVVALHGIACWSGVSHDLAVVRRGADTDLRRRVEVKARTALALNSSEMPIRSGWHPASSSRADGKWSRLSGPDRPSRLSFEMEQGRYEVTLEVLGAVSHAALAGLRVECASEILPVETVFDEAKRYFRCSMKLEVPQTGTVDLDFFVPEMKRGVGIEVAGIEIKGHGATQPLTND
jgi:hypothetical protein